MLWFNIVADLKVQSKKIRVLVAVSFHERRYAFLPIDWIQTQCYQKHGARIGVLRALFKPV
jgi:hypothetical protein